MVLKKNKYKYIILTMFKQNRFYTYVYHIIFVHQLMQTQRASAD